MEQLALRSWIWTALEAIGEDERLTLVLRHFTRCQSYQAIAAITGVPVGTVRSRLNRARHRLVATLTATAPPRDPAALEAARAQEWASFHQQLHELPEPRTYRGLYRDDVTVQDGSACWRGIRDWSAEERTAIDLGVRAQVIGLAATTDLTVLEIELPQPFLGGWPLSAVDHLRAPSPRRTLSQRRHLLPRFLAHRRNRCWLCSLGWPDARASPPLHPTATPSTRPTVPLVHRRVHHMPSTQHPTGSRFTVGV
jgi:transposase